MKCNKAKILISAALDGELSRKDQLSLNRHVSLCAECAREKSVLSDLRGAMALWTDEEPSEWLAQNFSHKLGKLMDEKRAAQPAPRRRFGVFAPAAGFAAAALLIVMLVHNRAVVPTQQLSQKSPSVASAPESGAKPDGVAVNSGENAIRIPQGNTHSGGETGVVRHPGHRRHAGSTHVASADTGRVKPVVAPTVGPDNVPAPGGGVIVGESAVSGVAPSAAANEIKYNIGEAGIAMNESMERLRGTLQEAVDLVVARPPVPVRDTEPVGGNIP